MHSRPRLLDFVLLFCYVTRTTETLYNAIDQQVQCEMRAEGEMVRDVRVQNVVKHIAN